MCRYQLQYLGTYKVFLEFLPHFLLWRNKRNKVCCPVLGANLGAHCLDLGEYLLRHYCHWCLKSRKHAGVSWWDASTAKWISMALCWVQMLIRALSWQCWGAPLAGKLLQSSDSTFLFVGDMLVSGEALLFPKIPKSRLSKGEFKLGQLMAPLHIKLKLCSSWFWISNLKLVDPLSKTWNLVLLVASAPCSSANSVIVLS